MLQDEKARVIMNPARPRVARTDQFLEGILTAFVEGADGRLINKMRPAGIDKPLDNGVAHFQCAACSAYAGACRCRILHIVVGTEGRVAEGGLRLAVPYLNVELLCKPLEIARAVIVGVVVVCGDRYRVSQRGVAHHAAAEGADSDFIGNDNLDTVIKRFLFFARKACVIRPDPLRILFRPRQIRRMLVNMGIDVIDHIAVFAKSGQNGVFIPSINFVVVVGPGGSIPAQDAHFEIRVHGFGIGCKLEAGMPGNVGIFIGRTHCGRVRAGGVVTVVAHLDFDMRHNGVISAEQDLQQFRISIGVLSLIIHQQSTGAVGAQYAKSLEREAVNIVGFDIIAVQQYLDRRSCILPSVFDHSFDLALGDGEPAQDRFFARHISVGQRHGNAGVNVPGYRKFAGNELGRIGIELIKMNGLRTAANILILDAGPHHPGAAAVPIVKAAAERICSGFQGL
ncbi:hypothetical protein D3C77_256970 [compost metagenome]